MPKITPKILKCQNLLSKSQNIKLMLATQLPKCQKFTLQLPKCQNFHSKSLSIKTRSITYKFRTGRRNNEQPNLSSFFFSNFFVYFSSQPSSPINKLYCRVPFSTSNLLRIGTKKMGSRALLLVKGVSSSSLPKNQLFCNFNCKSHFPRPNNNWVRTNCSTTQSSGPSLEPPDLPRLAQTARISLTPHEVSYPYLFSFELMPHHSHTFH